MISHEAFGLITYITLNSPLCRGISVKCTRSVDIKIEFHIIFGFLLSFQVFGVPIEHQEVNANNVPYLVARCVDFIDQYGMY